MYGRDWDYHPVTVPPSEAQFIEAMRLNATQIAAVYGLPPERAGGTRADSLDVLERGTAPRCRSSRRCARGWPQLETAFFRILPANRIVRLNSDALLKT